MKLCYFISVRRHNRSQRHNLSSTGLGTAVNNAYPTPSDQYQFSATAYCLILSLTTVEPAGCGWGCFAETSRPDVWPPRDSRSPGVSGQERRHRTSLFTLL